jgi:hypothetical protein
MIGRRKVAAGAIALVAGGSGLLAAPQAEAKFLPPRLGVSLSQPRLLLPGRTQLLWVRVHNPYDHAVKVTQLVTSVQRRNKRSCRPTGNLRFSPATRVVPVTIPAHGSRSGQWVEVRMSADADPDCQRSKFSFQVKVHAVKAGKR